MFVGFERDPCETKIQRAIKHLRNESCQFLAGYQAAEWLQTEGAKSFNFNVLKLLINI